MVNFTILAGGYATFVASYLFDSDKSTLALLNQSPTGANPSWITSHLTNKSILYATNENTDGMLQSFVIGPEGVLTGPIDQVSSGGDSPAFTAPLSTGQVAIMNYNSGNGKIIPTTSDPLHFSQSAPLITFPQPVGGVSHPHMAYEYEGEVFVPDLGGDKIWRLVEQGSPSNFKIQGFVQQPQGSGPRHMSIFDKQLYALHELSSTLTLQNVPPPPNGTTPFLANVSIIPPDPPQGADFAAAEILIPPPTEAFPTPYIYASNRNTGVQDPRGDAISIYERVGPKDELELVGQVYTGLDQIRGMEIGPSERGAEEFLIAGGVAGTGGVVMFRRIQGGRSLELIVRNTDVPTRTSFVWL